MTQEQLTDITAKQAAIENSLRPAWLTCSALANDEEALNDLVHRLAETMPVSCRRALLLYVFGNMTKSADTATTLVE